MRALILVLSALVVFLALPILWHKGGGARPGMAGELLHFGSLLSDAQAGEEVTYRDQEGNTLIWRVEKRMPAAVRTQERLLIRRRLLDRFGRLAHARWGDMAYEHDCAVHGWFPLMAPEEPQGLDRLWTWARIRRESRPYHGKERSCWRMDFIDPGLEAGSDEVRTWFHEDVPVFGLQEWHRGGRVWTLVSSSRGVGRS